MSLCINPDCDRAKHKIDQRQELFCSSCGSSLLLNNIYRVLQYLGSGGFGWTYLVDNDGTHKVLKILHNTHPKAISLFDQEAEVLQKLSHPGIPSVDEGGRFDYFPKRSTKTLRCLVMEYIEGDNLADYLAKQDFQPISESVAINWLHELVEILDLVHGAKYFHRDIKPSNIMIRNTGKLALIDFGTAREETQTYLQKQKGQNVTGIISVGYTPHEQAHGRAEYRSDFFALGRTFVFLLTGKEPDEFEETLTKGLLWQQKAQGYSQALRDLIDYLMRPEVTDRPSNTQEILQKIAVFAKIKKKTASILTTATLHKFLSENKAQGNTLTEFQFKKDTIEIGVHCPDFFISKKFNLEDEQNKGINARILVKSEEVAKIFPILFKAKEISFEVKDGFLYLSPDCSIPIERNLSNRDQAVQNLIVIKNAEVLHWLAQLTMMVGKDQTPPAPYIDGNLVETGYCVLATNGMIAAEYTYLTESLVADGSAISLMKGTHQRITLPTSAITKLDPALPVEIQLGPSMYLKSGDVSIKIEKLKDPLAIYLISQFYGNKGETMIAFHEPKSSSEPSRMDKIVNWSEQTKASVGNLLVSSSGIWIGPKGFVKKGFESNLKALQLSDTPIPSQAIAQFPVKVLVSAITLMDIKNDVKIFFPTKEGETLQFESENAIISMKAQLIEAPADAIASLPVEQLLDETPITKVEGETTLVEAPPTILEAIEQAIEEDNVPQKLKESVQMAQTMIEEKLVEKADFIEKMDTNIVPLDSTKRQKVQALQKKIKKTAEQLKTEMQKDDRDPNLIVRLTWRIDTLGGRFIQIIFALETCWWPTLTISEEVKQQAKESYPQLAA